MSALTVSTPTAPLPAAALSARPAGNPAGDDTWDGYFALQPLPAQPTEAARRRINEWLGAGMADPATAYLGRARQIKSFVWNSYGDAELRGHDDLHACFRPLEDPLRSMFGPDVRFPYTSKENQVALRFPQSIGAPHIDGLTFGRPFPLAVPAATVTIYLSDVGPDDAPLTVWPQAMADIQEIARLSLDGLPAAQARRRVRARLRRINFAEGAVPVTGPAGTVVVTHPALPHCNGLAASPNVRYAVIRRYYLRSWFDDTSMRPQSWDDAMAVLAGVRPGTAARWTPPGQPPSAAP